MDNAKPAQRQGQGSFQKAAEWQDIHMATSGNVTCTVSMLPIKPRPKYSIRFGFKAQNDRVIVNLPVLVQGRGIVSIEGPTLEDVDNVRRECIDFIAEKAQADEDSWIAERQKREKQQLDREKPKQSMGIKSLGKLDGMLKAARVTETKPEEPSSTSS